MITLQFNLRNPWSRRRWTGVFSKHGSALFDNKYWEMEVERNSDLINLHIQITHRQSHAGIMLGIGVFSYGLTFNFYDSRHWDYDNNKFFDKENT